MVSTPEDSSSRNKATPIPIRVPNNVNPGYGSISSATGFGGGTETPYYSAREEYPYMSRIGSFAESYTRATVLYMAENLTTGFDDGHHGVSRVTTADESIHEDGGGLKAPVRGLERTMSQRTASFDPEITGLLPPLSRPNTVASIISHRLKLEPAVGLKSTFAQTVFNAMNVLIGVGILAFPLAFRYAGWLLGSLIFGFCAIGTNYTAKLLARCLDAVHGASTYGDIGLGAFGDRGRAFIGTVFYVELATMAVAMITLLGDGLQALYPNLDLVTSRILCFVLMTPFEFFPLRKLSVASLIGIISCMSLVIIVLVDGLSKEDQPGSLWDPMATEWIPADLSRVPLSIGLMMAGFAGHAVFPAIYRDMENPKDYDKMVNITYTLTTLVYFVMAAAGYIMFGSETMQEITQNLGMTEGYYTVLTKVALWLVVITPTAKFALIMNPLHVAFEISVSSRQAVERWLESASWRHILFRAVSRIALTVLFVYIAVIFPGFDRVMSLLGALFSFCISIIFPLLCYQRLYGTSTSWARTGFHMVFLAVGITMASLGTAWSFMPNR